MTKEFKKEKPLIDLKFGMVPPQAKEMESAVLGAIMLEKDAFDTVSEILSADCFYSEANQRTFKAMKNLSDNRKPIDLLTVVEQLKTNEDLELVGGAYAISKLTNSVTSGANVVAHSEIVLQKFISREIIRISSRLITDAYDDSINPYELLDTAENNIMQIGTKVIADDMLDIETVLKTAMLKIQEWRLNDSVITGIASGFTDLDNATRGWQNGDLIIIGARPSVGKTALALNIARNAAATGIPTAFWSLEMKAVFLALRLLAAESEIYMHRIQTGRLEDHHMEQLIRKGFDELKKLPIYFEDNSVSNIRTLRLKARRLKKKKNLGLIVIDYLQLMEGEGKDGNREREIAKISRELKRLAQELDIPIIALSQLTRDSEKDVTYNHGPAVKSLRESGAIEQDADMIIMLWGASDSEIADDSSLDGKRKIKIAKQRNGVLVTVELDFRNEIQLFQAIEGNLNANFKPVKLNEPNPF